MRTGYISFDGQPVDCVLEKKQGSVYGGTLLAPISMQAALEFWSSYGEAVDSMMLSRVDELEERMPGRFRIRFGNHAFWGEDVDLQIYPSSLRFSFATTDDLWLSSANDGPGHTAGLSGHLSFRAPDSGSPHGRPKLLFLEI